ncbi:similar to Saccharomyces cerevisiae YMR075W RCO1 Essential subunit of the histone deacetylase Rpd3S complex [Maudiozyma saulgeensis]|uniref:Similar to Saccharomyces cerevisiae YMR075W RCO1 Essential subunit of the histone deacetylase Rpd3S complex n=1 Tax=Maudiozyma saulgeensis TaxID=1789683 RepID=A0A1X7R8L6_9SACH|nr:similar to Saccharomyces cerevisiae YMR075W RCO1 Essential subunit of the histone deacetylase Rpd3S complex [Kazachstania saulgeensis]
MESHTPSSQDRGHRPKRASSLNVNYDLKKRKIIQAFVEDKRDKKNGSNLENEIQGESIQPLEPLYIYDSKGNVIGMNDLSKGQNQLNENSDNDNINNSNNNSSHKLNTLTNDILNKATGLPLSHGPTQKIKKDSLWNYKKPSTVSTNNNSNSEGHLVASNKQDNDTMSNWETLNAYNKALRTNESENITKSSTLRFSISKIQSNKLKENDDGIITSPQMKEELHTDVVLPKPHVKIKSAEIKNSQLFNQNILNKTEVKSRANGSNNNNNNNISGSSTESSQEPNNLRHQKRINYQESPDVEEENTVDNLIENDDFCSSCLQTGSFLCCDTCPKSFHFLCLDPPVDPNNLPEGDWSCPNCRFKKLYPNPTQTIKGEREYTKTTITNGGSKMFSKLLFQSQSYNPRQFILPKHIKDTFSSVKTGDRGQYSNSTEKPELPYKTLFNAPYGQSVSKLDSYNPENHYVNDTVNTLGEDETFLLCYRCGTTRFGSWEHPEDSRLLIKCDYCNTPWHLDCVPDVPRASLKNLGLKWKCPLHANTEINRRLKRRHQKFFKPDLSCNFYNNGDIEIELDEIRSDGTKDMTETFKKIATGEDNNSIPLIEEKSIQLDFFSKIYNFKQAERARNFKMEEQLIDKLMTFKDGHKKTDIIPLLYFNISNHNKDKTLKKMWDFKELCEVATDKLDSHKENYTDSIKTPSTLPTNESAQLHILKKLIESKPKDEVMRFFGFQE